MSKNQTAPRKWLTTAEFASSVKLHPESIRKRYWLTGSYFGVVPTRLPNRLLLWPADGAEQLVRGAA
jgi:hypothetical protein